MGWVSGWRWIAGIWLAAGVANSAAWAADRIVDAGRERAVRVRVYNYSGVSAAVLEATRETAFELLGRAGVRLAFVDCRVRPEDPPADEACKDTATPLDLYVSILDRSMARNAGASRHCLGFALVTADLPSRATVFSHRALELVKSNRAPLAGILGAMVAHEIGHLLLEQTAHSPDGIMQARWSDDDLQTIARGRMLITAEQASHLTAMVAKRQQAWRASRSAARPETRRPAPGCRPTGPT
jgi:hypothetical protein